MSGLVSKTRRPGRGTRGSWVRQISVRLAWGTTLTTKKELNINLKNWVICWIVFVGLGTITTEAVTAAENLGQVLRKSTWNRVLGTWVDAETQGDRIRTAYAWRFEDQLVEIRTKQGTKLTLALMGLNAKTDEIYHMSADNQGGSSRGKWELNDGEAVLGIVFVSPEGEEGVLSIRHHLEDDDTLHLTVELPKPLKFKMVRSKKKK